uniref:Uncharacterized protein n=1 Tax=Ditylenchus dipsaci TaxID=166011 RepID=A0A915DV01_9BILA
MCPKSCSIPTKRQFPPFQLTWANEPKVKSSLCGSAQLYLSSHAQAPVKASKSSSNQCKAPSQASNQSPVTWQMEAVFSNKSLQSLWSSPSRSSSSEIPFEETVMPSVEFVQTYRPGNNLELSQWWLVFMV